MNVFVQANPNLEVDATRAASQLGLPDVAALGDAVLSEANRRTAVEIRRREQSLESALCPAREWSAA